MARITADIDLTRTLCAPDRLHIAAYEGPRVHVLAGGRIVRSGGPELAHELEAHGYAGMAAEAA